MLKYFIGAFAAVAAECSPFNDEKWAAEFQENLQKCADENMAKLHATMEKLYMA